MKNTARIYITMDIFPFAREHLDQNITQHAKRNAFGNAIGQRHNDNGKKDRQRFGNNLPDDFSEWDLS